MKGVVNAVRHHLAVVGSYLRVGLLNFVQYRTDFAVAVANALVGLVTQVIGLAVIFGQTTQLNGWDHSGLLVLVGVFFICSGLLGLVIRPSMQTLMEAIRLGTFDFTLTKPADSQVLASVQTVAPQAATDLLVGVGVIAWTLVSDGQGLHPWQVGAFLVALACGLAIIYSFLLMLSTFSFWFVKLDNILVVFEGLFQSAGRWPVSIFPPWLRLVLTFVVPVSFAVTVPAQAIVLGVDGATLAAAVGVAVLFLTGSRLFWRHALRHYTGASA
ncbi:ABC transporter permease [Aestuariimicrobium kwangyangense]|uniref:ABC transporter permease n=1 Tax=Aestuariimicrobium kwangyangense TaxID=396389 RepID=UPI00058CC765|nr:ABC-2 family transporter protein [Aestuariimicrobium kwangyangense]